MPEKEDNGRGKQSLETEKCRSFNGWHMSPQDTDARRASEIAFGLRPGERLRQGSRAGCELCSLPGLRQNHRQWQGHRGAMQALLTLSY